MIDPKVTSRDGWVNHQNFHKNFVKSAAAEIQKSISKYAGPLGGTVPKVSVNDKDEIVIEVEDNQNPEEGRVMKESLVEQGIKEGLDNIGEILDESKARTRADTGESKDLSDIEKVSKAQEQALK
jgi:hypothetical protein